MSQQARHSFLRRPIVIGCSALMLALSLSACGSKEAAPAAEPVRPAYVVTARDGASSALPFVGEVRAAQRAELSFAVAGSVASVAAEAGNTVRRGQVLATLDETPLQAQLAAATADVKRTTAQLNEVRERKARIDRAQQADAVSSAETGAVQLELSSAEAALRSAQAQRDSAAWSLGHARLRAPIDGVIAQRNIERGQAAAPGAPVMVIDGSGRELVVTVPGELDVKSGQAVSLRGQGTELASRVLRVGGRLDAGGVRKLWLEVPPQASVGSTWTVSVQAGEAKTATAVVQVPLRAVLPGTTENTGSVLRLAGDGSTLETSEVRLGAIHGEWVDVASGVKPGDRVVIAGALSMRPGQKVKPIESKR